MRILAAILLAALAAFCASAQEGPANMYSIGFGWPAIEGVQEYALERQIEGEWVEVESTQETTVGTQQRAEAATYRIVAYSSFWPGYKATSPLIEIPGPPEWQGEVQVYTVLPPEVKIERSAKE